MSRNITAKKAGATPRPVIKLKVPPSSTQNLSDSEGYSALDDASDSDDEDEEEDVEAAEEQHLIDRALLGARSGSSRPSDDSAEEAEEEEDADEDEDSDSDIDDLSSMADDADDEEGGNGQEDDNISWNGFLTDEEHRSQHSPPKSHKPPTSAERRVRFAADVPVPMSDSDMETDTDSMEYFPDLFTQAEYSPSIARAMRRHDNLERPHLQNHPLTDYNRLVDQVHESLRPTSGTEDETSGTTPTTNTPANFIPGPLKLLYHGANAGGRDSEDSNDSDASTDTETEETLILGKMKRIENPTRLDGPPKPETVTKHNGKPRSGKVKIQSSGDRGVVVFDQKKKRLITLTRSSVRAMDQMVEMGEKINSFYELPSIDFSQFPNVDLSQLPHDLLSLPNIPADDANVMLGQSSMPNEFSPTQPGIGQTGPREAFFSPVGLANGADATFLSNFSSEDPDASTDEAEGQLDLDTFFNFEEDVTEAEMNGDFSRLPSQEEPTTGNDEPGTSPEPSSMNADVMAGAEVSSFLNTFSGDMFPEETTDHAASGLDDSIFPLFSDPSALPEEWLQDTETLDASSLGSNHPLAADPPGGRRKRASADMPPPPSVAGRKRLAQSGPETSHKKQRSISELGSIRI